MKVKVKILKEKEFLDLCNEDKIFDMSEVGDYQIEKEYNDDDRDEAIKYILSDEVILSINSRDDTFKFVDIVERGILKCDLTDEYNVKNSDILILVIEINKYTEEYILDNLNRDYKFLKIGTLNNLPIDLFDKHPDKFNWESISFLNITDFDFIEKNKERIYWNNFQHLLKTDYYEDFIEYLNIDALDVDMEKYEELKELKIYKTRELAIKDLTE
jgi:hypothetical protein